MKRKINKRTVALLISLAVLLTVVVTATVAYIVHRTQTVINTFQPSSVSCAVVEGPEHAYTVKNTGDTDAYIRVAVAVNWKTSSGNIWAKAPEAGTDYTLVLGTGWKRGNDGYYYYSLSVPATDDQQTGIDERVIGSYLTVRKLKDGPAGSDGAQCELSVEILASAIQTTADAVTAWSSGVAEMEPNGTLTVQAAGID